MNHQPAYSPMQAKAPPPPGPGLYPSGPYQPVPPVSFYHPDPPVSSYPPSPGQPLLSRPPLGGLSSCTPPQSASPGPRIPPPQPTPPPAVSSSSYYSNPQQPMAPTWQYNAAPPPVGPATSMSTPPRGPLANHVNPLVSLAGPSSLSSSAYSSAPPLKMSLSSTQTSSPGVPPTSMHGYTQPGRNTNSSLICSIQKHNIDAF